MTREEVRDSLIDIEAKNMLLQLPTSFGKSKIALDILDSKGIKDDILIVVPRNTIKDSWIGELQKWGYSDLKVTLTTYKSFPKHVGEYKAVIFDECHHLTKRCRAVVPYFKFDNVLLLSATVAPKQEVELKGLFDNLICHKISTREAIENEILPDPKVYLIPLKVNNTVVNQVIIRNPDKPNEVTVRYRYRWSHYKQKSYRVKILCTEGEYLAELNNKVEYLKKLYYKKGTKALKQRWLATAKERLQWLSTRKNTVVLQLLKKLKDNRTITFCGSIEQTEVLGKYCVNSKNKESKRNLERFNEGKIKHITACNMLDEGVNLTKCQIGIYSILNSSEIMMVQKLGRLLRHPKPVVIIPYFQNTREEEIVQEMLENYNPDLVEVIDNINNFKL